MRACHLNFNTVNVNHTSFHFLDRYSTQPRIFPTQNSCAIILTYQFTLEDCECIYKVGENYVDFYCNYYGVSITQ